MFSATSLQCIRQSLLLCSRSCSGRVNHINMVYKTRKQPVCNSKIDYPTICPAASNILGQHSGKLFWMFGFNIYFRMFYVWEHRNWKQASPFMTPTTIQSGLRKLPPRRFDTPRLIDNILYSRQSLKPQLPELSYRSHYYSLRPASCRFWKGIRY